MIAVKDASDATAAVATTPSTDRDERPQPVLTARQLIPGAYERKARTPRQPGSMGGSLFGSTVTPAGPSSMDKETTEQRRKEGGSLNRAR